MDDDLPDLDLPEEFRKGVAFAEACAAESEDRWREVVAERVRQINERDAEIARLRAVLLAIRERGYVLGLGAADWPVKDCEDALGVTP